MSYITESYENAYDLIEKMVLKNMQFIHKPEKVYGDEFEIELEDILDLETPERYKDDIRTKLEILINVVDNFSDCSSNFRLNFSAEDKATYDKIKKEVEEIKKEDWIGNSGGNVVNLGKLVEYLQEDHDLDELYFEGDSNYIRDEDGNVIYELPLPNPVEEEEKHRYR